MDNDISFEERLELSSIIYKQETFTEIPPLTESSIDFQVLISDFNKSIAFNTTMNLTSLPSLSTLEQNLACMLLFTSNQIRKKSKQLSCTLSKKFNHRRNNELNFVVKQVSLLFESIICGTELYLDWDVTPNCYINCELDVHFNRHYFINICTEKPT